MGIDLVCCGEFGYEMIAAVPYAYWLHQRGQLGSTKSALDTKCFYYFSPHHEEAFEVRDFDMGENRKEWDNYPIHRKDLNKTRWQPPPFKEHYKNDVFVFEKPILVITNKNTVEWPGRFVTPKNFFSRTFLAKLFGRLHRRFTIIYNRPTAKDIVQDRGPEVEFPEHEWMARQFPNVIRMQSLHSAHPELTFNQLQCMVYANCNFFLSVQGGSSILASYFGGTNIIYANAGRELDARFDSFNRWYHEFSGSKIIPSRTYDAVLEAAKNLIT